MTRFTQLSLAATLIAATGCSIMMRDPEGYRTDTRTLLASKDAELQSCYNEVLKQDKTAAGTVSVKFTVQAETGAIVDPEIDAAGTTAPEPLGQCVLNAMNGLTIEPPDELDGIATFVYEFKAEPAPAPAAAAEATAADTAEAG